MLLLGDSPRFTVITPLCPPAENSLDPPMRDKERERERKNETDGEREREIQSTRGRERCKEQERPREKIKDVEPGKRTNLMLVKRGKLLLTSNTLDACL